MPATVQVQAFSRANLTPVDTHGGRSILAYIYRQHPALPKCPQRAESNMSEMKQIQAEDVDGVKVVRFVQERILDEADIQQLGEELYSFGEESALLLNFSDVRFLSSAALGKLIKLDKKIKQGGGKLVLSNIRPEIEEIFSITRLDRLFVIKESQDEGLAAF